MKRGNNNILSGKKLRSYFSNCQVSICSSVLSRPQQRFGVTDIKALGVSQLSGLGQTMFQLSGLKRTVLQLLDKSVLPLRVTALFYLDNSRKIHPRGVRACRPRDAKRRVPQRVRVRERAHASELAQAPLFMFSLPGPVLCKLGQPGVLFLLPEVLTRVLGPSFVRFSPAFLFLIFQPPPFCILNSFSLC